MNKNKTKTICFFNSNRAWGGGEKWHFTTALFFSKKNYTTYLVTNLKSQLRDKALENNLNTFSFPIRNLTFLNPFKIYQLVRYFQKNEIEIVIMNLPSDLKAGGIAAKIAGVKKIMYRRGMPHPLRNTLLNRFLFKNVLTDIIVNSEEIGRSLRQGNESWFPLNKLRLVYNGVDTRKPISKETKLIEKKNDEIIIGNAGRLTDQKGQKYLIDLAKKLLEQKISFTIYIAGIGELEDHLNHLITTNKLEHYVKLIGHVNDMPSFFNSLDVFVFTSLYEGSANTLIETLHYKVPTVAWDISSNPEVVEHKKSGYLARPFDIEDLINGINYVRDGKTISEGSHQVSKRFDTHRNLESLEEIL